MVRNDEIKVIKRIKDIQDEQKKNVITPLKGKSNAQRKIGIVVKDWISERRENSRIEKLFSESNISAWQISTSKLIEEAS